MRFKPKFRSGMFKNDDHIDWFDIPIGKIVCRMIGHLFCFDVLTEKQVRCIAGHSLSGEIISLLLNLYIDDKSSMFLSCVNMKLCSIIGNRARNKQGNENGKCLVAEMSVA